MTTKIYEYTNTTPSGLYKTTFAEKLIRDYNGRGCWELEVEIPDGLKPYTNEIGDICIISNGLRFSLSEILKSKNEKPVLIWFDENKNKKEVIPEVKSRVECSTALYL